MEIVAGPFVVAAALLVVAGVAKVLAPEATAAALRSVGGPGGRPVARALGIAEVSVGGAALAFGGRLSAALLAVVYLSFVGFVALALRRRDAAGSCGCFGSVGTPPTIVHLVVNMAAAAVGAAAVALPVGSLASVLSDQPLGGAAFLVYAALGTYLAYLALTALPRTLAMAGLGHRA